MKRQTKTILIVAIIAVVAIIFIYPRIDMMMGKEEGSAPGTQAPQGPGKPIPVNVIEVKPQRLENNLNITGAIIPNETVNLRAEISGLVDRITFKEGEFVKKGSPLLYLNDDELKAQFDRLDYTKKLYESQENRQKQLLAKEAISQEEYDVSLNQFNTNLADLRLVEAQLNKTIIRAPFDGVLGLRQISEGSVIGTSDVIASIVNIDPIKIEFSIPERYSNQVKLGSKIIFSNDGSGVEREGTVYAYEPTIDAATRTLRLRAESQNKDRVFLPGMFVRIRYTLGIEENALLVPAESVIPELSGYKVYVANAENQAEERIVSIGTRTDSQVHIVDGLKEGDLVLTTGILQVRTGSPLEVTKTK
ncbi:efflux RND transporter periplasmic adaptor subunit [Belliella sp. DSM 111904]|uniref:Efflux RND transporter periplasmic adaptor subunit n=1 Tax=Belliella filtrata TaxID=2923435 RepID=A0ABS9V2T1_9BACT|nr:efflux RND transporter periplasmic adaptor subunit [Belliella filtrata]MCH7410717.1 efflux RND transporter periplasmic adaptor subunit [Belliella filtrata]